VTALKDLGLWDESASESKSEASSWRQVAVYPYRDENGELLFEMVRFERGSGGARQKKLLGRRPDGRWGIQGVRRVPYHLPELIEAAITFIVEGEKDVEALRAWGFVATCNPLGAGKWDPSYNPFFRGKEVLVIPDDDEPGWRHATQTVRGILPYAAGIRVLNLGCKDISDWFTTGHRELELIALVERDRDRGREQFVY
jgi:putative DNA primase/helicase